MMSNIYLTRRDMGNLFGFAALNPPLCVTNVQVFWILCVEVSHNIQPSEKYKLDVKQLNYST